MSEALWASIVNLRGPDDIYDLVDAPCSSRATANRRDRMITDLFFMEVGAQAALAASTKAAILSISLRKPPPGSGWFVWVRESSAQGRTASMAA